MNMYRLPKKLLRMGYIVCAVSSFILLTSCEKIEQLPSTESLEVEICTKDSFEQYYLKETFFTSKEETTVLVENTLKDIEKVLDMPYWWKEINPNATKLYCNMSFSNTSSHSLAKMSATKMGENGIYGDVLLSTKISPDGGLAHELTHMIGYMDDFSASLDEGMCEYVYDKVGKVERRPKNCSIHDYVSLMMQNDYSDEKARVTIDEFLSHIGAAQKDYPYEEGTMLNYYYMFSDSFVSYLIDEYSIENVKKLILEGTDIKAYNTYLGKDYETVKNEWIDFILSYKPKITMEDVRQFTIKQTN